MIFPADKYILPSPVSITKICITYNLTVSPPFPKLTLCCGNFLILINLNFKKQLQKETIIKQWEVKCFFTLAVSITDLKRHSGVTVLQKQIKQ